MASLSFLAKWEPAGLYLLSGKYPASPFAAPLLAFLFICFSHSRSLTPVFLHSWQPSLAFLILFLSTYLFFFFFYKLEDRKDIFLLPMEHRRGVKELLYFLNNMEQTDLDDDSMASGHQKLSCHLFFLKPVSLFSRRTHTRMRLVTETTYNELPPHFLSKKTVHGDMSQLFIHTELDGISQHFKTLAEISKKA